MDLISSIATSRLMAQQNAMDVISTNMANANTPGFRTGRVQFSDWISRQTGTSPPRGGETVAYTQDRATWREPQAGAISHTGNPFDLALAGDGYFTVNTPRGTRLTRDGRFGPMPDGTLADSAGNAVLDTAGNPIKIAPNDIEVTIAGDGTISGRSGQLGRIGVVKPNDPMQMAAEGATLFNVKTGGTAPVASPGIVQGAVEDSNVQPIREITRMMDNMRQFQLVTQLIEAESDRQKNVIDKLLPQGS
jgi:flagellar basal-body rod protein FlgF